MLSTRARSLCLLLVSFALGCGKDSAKPAGKAEPGPAAAQAVAPPPAAAKPVRLASLPLSAEVGPAWKVSEDKVTGGASLRTETTDVGVAKDGVGGVKATTLDDEKKLMSSLSASAQEVTEDKLADGWVLSYKIPGVLAYHGTVVRQIAGQGYRCVVQAEEAAGRAEGLAICKGMKP